MSAVRGLASADYAWTAGVIDTWGSLWRRPLDSDTVLPEVRVHGSNRAVLAVLSRMTGTRPVDVHRAYARTPCLTHCQERHQHIESVSGRWTLTGARATVVLFNVAPFMRIRQDEARDLLDLGLSAPFKPRIVSKMAQLGWHLPPQMRRIGEAVPA